MQSGHRAQPVLTVAAECGGSNDHTASTPLLGGSYIGLVGTYTLRMTLVKTSGVVSGVGTLTNTSNGTRALNITGTFVAPTLKLTTTTTQLPLLLMTGTVSMPHFTATLSGYGIAGDAFMLDRE